MKKYIFSFIAVLALAVQAADFRIIPTPKKQVFGKEITLAGTVFSIENKFPGFSPEEMVSNHLKEYGFERTAGKSGIKIRFIQDKTDKWLAKYKESYRLEINSKAVTVCAYYPDGAWRGAGRMLAILCGPDAKISEKGITLPEMKIADVPDIETRAMKIEFPTTSGEELIRQVKPVIRSVAMFGFNTIFLDFRGNLECKKHPELAQKPVLPQKDLAELIRYSRSCGLEVMPWTNSIGHLRRAPLIFPIYGKSTSGWVDPTKNVPVVMDLTHPDFYKVLFDYFDEVLDLFGSPRYFQVGCDEFHDGMKILRQVYWSAHGKAQLQGDLCAGYDVPASEAVVCQQSGERTCGRAENAGSHFKRDLRCDVEIQFHQNLPAPRHPEREGVQRRLGGAVVQSASNLDAVQRELQTQTQTSRNHLVVSSPAAGHSHRRRVRLERRQRKSPA